MKAIRAKFKNGKVTLAEQAPENGPVDVLVVFPEAADDPWQAILAEKKPRRAFAQFAKKCLKEIAQH